MGELSDRPSTAAASGPQYPAGWNPFVTEGDYEAEAVSPAYTGDQRPSEEELIRGWRLDPDFWEIIDGTLIVNRWQGMTGKDNGNALVWQHQYKARLRRKVLADDEKLPFGLRTVPHFGIKVTGRPRSRKGTLPWEQGSVGVFYPDPQFGFWWDEYGELHTIHDERCFDIRNQIMVDLRAEYGRIDKTVGAGDTGDFTHFSRFASSPNYLERTLQPTLDRIGLDAQQMRAICPGEDEEIVWLDGNHDNPRLINTLITKGLGSLVGLRRAGDSPDAHPVLSLQNLVRLDDYRVRYVEPFPTGLVEFNQNLGCAHGPAYSSKKLGTATAVLNSARRSMLHGHTHREEHIAVTLWTERGPRTYYVGSPGTFCRTDLVVPSAKSNVNSRGVPSVGQGTEDWQQGLFVVLYDGGAEGHFNIENVRIWNGLAHEPSVAYWRDRKYVSTVDADGRPL